MKRRVADALDGLTVTPRKGDIRKLEGLATSIDFGSATGA